MTFKDLRLSNSKGIGVGEGVLNNLICNSLKPDVLGLKKTLNWRI